MADNLISGCQWGEIKENFEGFGARPKDCTNRSHFFDIKSSLCYKFFTSKHSIQREAAHDKKNQSPWDGCEES